jgi:hypothetical protein
VVVAASAAVTAAAAAAVVATAGKLLSSIFSDRRPGASRAFFMAGTGATLGALAIPHTGNANDKCVS